MVDIVGQEDLSQDTQQQQELMELIKENQKQGAK